MNGEAMDLSSVNSVGVIAFLCFKFAGYLLLFVLLKRVQPAVQASVILMASARAVLGILAGGMLYFGWDAARHRFSGFYNFSLEAAPYYSVLFVLRVLVWAATIYIFWRSASLRHDKVWLYALGGSLWSSLMDVPAAIFALFVPGGVLFC
jgi:hypothetical protein